MKKMLVLLVVLMLAFAVVLPAAAKSGPRGTFAIAGTITSIGTNSVTVKVVCANTLVKSYVGTQVTLTVNPKTVYNLTNGTTIKIGFADLKVGQNVSVGGTVADGTWTVARITVGASLVCVP
jgi:hypothetical protein